MTTHYLRGDRVDELLGRVDISGSTETQYWYLTDHLGSIRTIVTATGTVASKIDYDAFGNITAETNPAVRGNYAYTARFVDKLTGLQDNRARWYDPDLGRFLTKDPIGFSAGDPNVYRYVHNMPTGATDPSGLADPPSPAEIIERDLRLLSQSRASLSEVLRESRIQDLMRTGLVTRAEAELRVMQSEAVNRLHNQYLDEAAEARERELAAYERDTELLRAGTEFGGGFVPGVGEALDLRTAADPSAPWWERGLAGVSLGVNVFTVGLLPNYSSTIGAARRAGRAIGGAGDACNARRAVRGVGAAPASQFTVGRHWAMPSPRPGQQSHHGAMSAWVRNRHPHYDPDLAPAVLMPEANHQATFGVYNTWRAQMRQRMGGTFDWSRVSEAEMRALSESMFDAAQVPASVRQQYWAEYQRMMQALQRQAGGG